MTILKWNSYYEYSEYALTQNNVADKLVSPQKIRSMTAEGKEQQNNADDSC